MGSWGFPHLPNDASPAVLQRGNALNRWNAFPFLLYDYLPRHSAEHDELPTSQRRARVPSVVLTSSRQLNLICRDGGNRTREGRVPAQTELGKRIKIECDHTFWTPLCQNFQKIGNAAALIYREMPWVKSRRGRAKPPRVRCKTRGHCPGDPTGSENHVRHRKVPSKLPEELGGGWFVKQRQKYCNFPNSLEIGISLSKVNQLRPRQTRRTFIVSHRWENHSLRNVVTLKRPRLRASRRTCCEVLTASALT